MVTCREFEFPSINKDTIIAARKWFGSSVPPVAVLQIAHGMAEHIGRYDEFARYMAERGFVVVGNDHLGHGRTKKNNGEYGYFGITQGKNLLVADMHTLTEMTAKEYPSLPYFFLGHSMGSFLLREYLTLYGDQLDGAIIMGTGSMSPVVLSAGLGLVRLTGAIKGDDYRSPMVSKMMFGTYVDKIDNPKTPFDWLSTVRATVDAYMKDRSSGFMFTINGFEHMLINLLFVSSKKAIDEVPKSLPLLLIAGGQDPVGDYGKGVMALTEKYRSAGVADVSEILYPHDRHEVLNEANKEQVFVDIGDWLDARIGS